MNWLNFTDIIYELNYYDSLRPRYMGLTIMGWAIAIILLITIIGLLTGALKFKDDKKGKEAENDILTRPKGNGISR